MALNDVKHVEAYSIIKRLTEEAPYPDGETLDAAEVWLRENKPAPSAYTAAVESLKGGVATELEGAADEGMGC